MAQLDDFEIQEFKKLVQKWLSIDDDIRKLKEAEKNLNKAKKDLTPAILAFMAKNQIEDIGSNNGKLKYSVTLHKKPLSKDFLIEKLSSYLNNQKKGEEITGYLLENREVEEKINLRRVISRKNFN